MSSIIGSVFASIAGFGSVWGRFGLAFSLVCRCLGLASDSVVVIYLRYSSSFCALTVSVCSYGRGCAYSYDAHAYSYRAAGCVGSPGFLNSHAMTLGSSQVYPQFSRHHTLPFSETSESAPQIGQVTIFYA